MFYNFKSVFIAYLTLAVVPSKRLTNTNSVKVLIPYVGPKFVPALHTVGIQKCISVIFFFFSVWVPSAHLHCSDFREHCCCFSSAMAAGSSGRIWGSLLHRHQQRSERLSLTLSGTHADLGARAVLLSMQVHSTSFPSRNSIGSQSRVQLFVFTLYFFLCLS